MGEVNRQAENRKQHEEYSKLLIQYTEKAREIVEQKHLGKLTYAGGDDLLALANLKHLLPMLKELREEFPCFTGASAGVCIAHNKMPLSDVLGRAQRMEIAAKDNDRDSFGIALFKHSGNSSEMVTHWKQSFPDENLGIITVGEKLVKLLSNDEISKRFLYTFRDTVTKLIGDDKDLHSHLPLPLVEAEFARLIERAYKTKGDQIDDVDPKLISQTIKLLFRITPFTNFLGFLEIVNFIAREAK